MFLPNWSFKTEALYWALGRMSVPDTSMPIRTASGLFTTSVSYSGVVTRAGVNYHFNWGGPVSLLANQ